MTRIASQRTSGKPPKRRNSFSVRRREELIVHKPRIDVRLRYGEGSIPWSFDETGQQRHVVELALGGMREHHMRPLLAIYWVNQIVELIDRGFLDADDNVRRGESSMDDSACLHALLQRSVLRRLKKTHLHIVIVRPNAPLTWLDENLHSISDQVVHGVRSDGAYSTGLSFEQRHKEIRYLQRRSQSLPGSSLRIPRVTLDVEE